MKIAIDISQIVYEGTGVAQYTKALVEHILRQDSENTYLLFGMSGRHKKTLDAFVRQMSKLSPRVVGKIYPVPEKVENIVWNSFHAIPIERWIGRVDVLHSSDWIQPPTQARTVTTIHDVITMKYPETSHPYIVDTQRKRLAWVKKECNHILADSLATKQDIQTYLQIAPEKISVVYPGVDSVYTERDEVGWAAVDGQYHLPASYLFTVGTQEPRKNLGRLIKAYAQLRAQASQTEKKHLPGLVIAGKYGWGQAVQETEGVRLLGYVAAAHLPALYQHATAFVFPSLYEGFGLPVAEAMASGCPVITSDRGSLAEVATEAALIIDPENTESVTEALQRLLRDEALRSDLIKRGKQKAQQFTWKQAAGDVIRIYQSV